MEGDCTEAGKAAVKVLSFLLLRTFFPSNHIVASPVKAFSSVALLPIPLDAEVQNGMIVLPEKFKLSSSVYMIFGAFRVSGVTFFNEQRASSIFSRTPDSKAVQEKLELS